MSWPRLIVTGLVACVAVVAWAIHDVARSWETSLRASEEGDMSDE